MSAKILSADTLAPASNADELRELLAHCHACQDETRRTLARQLHDQLGSSLSALSMHLSQLAQQIPPNAHLQARMSQMKHLLHDVIEHNRALQTRLWNHQLEFSGLSAALSALAINFAKQHQLALHCVIPELACPPNHARALLLTLEEGFSNIAAHAQARSVDVTLSEHDDGIRLCLHDDGIGCHHQSLQDKHGLRTLRERIAYLGGRLSLSADHGSTLMVFLPKQAI